MPHKWGHWTLLMYACMFSQHTSEFTRNGAVSSSVTASHLKQPPLSKGPSGLKGACLATSKYNQEAWRVTILCGDRITEQTPQHPQVLKGSSEILGDWAPAETTVTHLSTCLLLFFSHPCLITATPLVGLCRITSQVSSLQPRPSFRNCFEEKQNYNKSHFLSRKGLHEGSR